MLLHVQMRIAMPDGTDIVAPKLAVPINGTLNSLFKTAEITIGSTVLPNSQGSVPFVAYLYSLLSYGNIAQKSALRGSLWYKDTVGHFDDVSAANKNEGYINRSAWTLNTVCDMTGPLLLDLCRTSRLILNRVNINIKLFRSSPQFLLMTDEKDDSKNFKVSISLAELHVRKFKLRCADLLRIEQELSRRNARYAYVQNSMFTISMPANTKNIGMKKMRF